MIYSRYELNFFNNYLIFNWSIKHGLGNYKFEYNFCALVKKIRKCSRKNSRLFILYSRLQLPTLVDPKYNEPIMLVSEDDKDIMNSRLLGSRSICEEMNKSDKASKKEHMVVITDFLK